MITWTRRGGRWSKKSLFLSMFRVKNIHLEVDGGLKGQNCVHIVIACPLKDKLVFEIWSPVLNVIQTTDIRSEHNMRI